jgi:hypothetical protein
LYLRAKLGSGFPQLADIIGIFVAEEGSDFLLE